MKKILILATILVLVGTAAVIVYFRWRSDFVKNRVPELVFLKSDSVYQISYSKVFIDELNGEIKIENIVLRPDTTYKKNDQLPRELLEVSIPLLHVSGLRTEEAMLNEEVIARKLLLDNPVVTLYNNDRDEKKDKTHKATTREVYKAILRNLTRIKVDSVVIGNARYSMVHWKSRDTILSGSPVNVSLFDIHISDSTAADTSRVFFSKKALVNVERLRINNESKLYSYRIANVELNSQERELTTQKISIVPRLGEDAFMRQAGRQTDRFDVDFSGARFINIDVNQALDGNIVADNLTMKEGILKIYRDKNLPGKNINKVGRYPHQLLMNMPVSVALKKVNINSGYIEYKEKSNLTGNLGKIRFHNINLTIYNLSNRPEDLRDNPVCRVDMRAQFLDAVPFNVTLRLYPGHKSGKFTADGKLGATDATVFNQLIQPLGKANIESGKLNSCEFHLSGNDYNASGTVTVLYNDLHVKILDKEGGEYKPKKLVSFLANATLKDDNPKKNKPVRVARVNYKRDVYKSFFNLIWKSIFTGISETVGMEAMQPKTDSR